MTDDESARRENFYVRAKRILKTFGVRMQLSPELEGTLRLIPANQLSVNFAINKTPFFQMPQKFCRLCHRYGHLQTRCPDNELPQLKPLPDRMDPTYDQLLTGICFEIFDGKKMDRNDEQIQCSILEDLEEFIREEIPNARLELFGSTKNGFGARFCDLDICMTFDDNATGEGLEFAKIVENVGQVLKAHRKLQNIIPIPMAKVPIVKFGYNFDRNRYVDCDISLYNILARYNTLWLRLCTLIDARVQVLGFVVKHFAKVFKKPKNHLLCAMNA
jgi:terminal uridylyltransferase